MGRIVAGLSEGGGSGIGGLELEVLLVLFCRMFCCCCCSMPLDGRWEERGLPPEELTPF